MCAFVSGTGQMSGREGQKKMGVEVHLAPEVSLPAGLDVPRELLLPWLALEAGRT